MFKIDIHINLHINKKKLTIWQKRPPQKVIRRTINIKSGNQKLAGLVIISTFVPKQKYR